MTITDNIEMLKERPTAHDTYYADALDYLKDMIEMRCIRLELDGQHVWVTDYSSVNEVQKFLID